MNTITSYSERDVLANTIGELVQRSVADGVQPADLSTALTVAAIRIGLQYAPNAGVALAVVMKAASDVAVESFTVPKLGDDERGLPAAPTETTVH